MIELTLRIVFSLLVVFGLLWGLARLARRPLAGRGAGALRVLARQQLSRGSSVAVIRVADRALVLGVSDAGVTLLADADPDLFEAPASRVPDEPARSGSGPLAGSALSRDTWSQALAFFRRGRS
jgi:flagellar protein FliO/FliZ